MLNVVAQVCCLPKICFRVRFSKIQENVEILTNCWPSGDICYKTFYSCNWTVRFLQFHWLWPIKQNETDHNDNQHYDTQHNDTQHNNTQHNDIQHNDTQHNDTQHNWLICDTQPLNWSRHTILRVIMLYVFMLSVANKPVLLSVIMLSVVMLSAVAP